MRIVSNLGRRFAPCLVLTLVGCGSSNVPDTLPRKAVSGIVTLDGKPLATGTIQFNPIEAKEGASVFAVSDIENGNYSIPKTSGPVAGKYKVLISSRPAIKIDPANPPGGRPKMEPEKVPAQYNVKSDLTKDITDGESNKLDFELKSQ